MFLNTIKSVATTLQITIETYSIVDNDVTRTRFIYVFESCFPLGGMA